MKVGGGSRIKSTGRPMFETRRRRSQQRRWGRGQRMRKSPRERAPGSQEVQHQKGMPLVGADAAEDSRRKRKESNPGSMVGPVGTRLTWASFPYPSLS